MAAYNEHIFSLIDIRFHIFSIYKLGFMDQVANNGMGDTLLGGGTVECHIAVLFLNLEFK